MILSLFVSFYHLFVRILDLKVIFLPRKHKYIVSTFITWFISERLIPYILPVKVLKQTR
jgi:hypothetical protein